MSDGGGEQQQKKRKYEFVTQIVHDTTPHSWHTGFVDCETKVQYGVWAVWVAMGATGALRMLYRFDENGEPKEVYLCNDHLELVRVPSATELAAAAPVRTPAPFCFGTQ